MGPAEVGEDGSQLQLSTIVAEVSEMEAFTVQDDASSLEG
jgi:hypothetical protein